MVSSRSPVIPSVLRRATDGFSMAHYKEGRTATELRWIPPVGRLSNRQSGTFIRLLRSVLADGSPGPAGGARPLPAAARPGRRRPALPSGDVGVFRESPPRLWRHPEQLGPVFGEWGAAGKLQLRPVCGHRGQICGPRRTGGVSPLWEGASHEFWRYCWH